MRPIRTARMTTKVRRPRAAAHPAPPACTADIHISISSLPLRNTADDEGGEGVDNAEDIDMEVDASPATDAPQPPPAFFTTLVAPVLKLVQPAPLSFPPLDGPSAHPPMTSALGAIHVSALECLNNVFLSMATSLGGRPSGLAPENGREVFDAVWGALGAVGTDIADAGQERRREVWDIGMGVLWGVGNVWKGALMPTEEQVQVLTQFCGVTADPAVKVKTIGTLECLAQHPASVGANRVSGPRCYDFNAGTLFLGPTITQCLCFIIFSVPSLICWLIANLVLFPSPCASQAISSYLLSLLPPSASPPTPTEPLLQAVSALIDIYSDETLPYDVNFRSGRYLDALIQSAEAVRKAVRSIDRKKERELRVHGEEVRDNLVAFIQYRRGLRL